MQTSGFISDKEESDKIETLGIRGATSETFKQRIDGRLYFVKQLRPEYRSDKRYREAFRKEYEVGKSIDSPYIVKYVAMEEEADGLCILMEYVNGVTLADKQASEPEYFRKEQHVKKLLLQVAQALAVLHRRNIVHMDLKPENILLTKGNNDVMLVDLGFCLSDKNDSTVGCTRQFAAPEVVKGDIKDIDARTDIYSVGCLLQWIEENTGRALSRTYINIKNRCLLEQKSERYASTGEIVKVIKNRHRNMALGVLALLAVVLAIVKSPFVDAVCNYVAWAMGKVPQRFEAEGIFYRITDETERTVAVTFKGNTPKEYKYEYEGGEITIPPTVSYKGREFRVTAVDALTFDSPYISRVTIPEGLVTIADSAFLNCNQNGVIYIPKSVEKIGIVAFPPMYYIDGFVVDPDNLYYDSREGCNAIIETATNTILAGSNNSVIPDGVERIAQEAFGGAMRLKHLVLPGSLKEIGESAFVHSGIEEIDIPKGVTRLERYTFQYCENLQRITLPESLTTIGLGALSHCAFKEVVIPDGVTHLGDYAMDCCERLEKLTIGSGVKHIGYAAFENCKRLKRVVSRIPADSLFVIDNTVFNLIDEDCVLYVPRGAKKSYENTFGWNRFDSIKEY